MTDVLFGISWVFFLVAILTGIGGLSTLGLLFCALAVISAIGERE